MKSVIQIIFISLIFFISSCSDDDTSKKDIQTCVTENLGITEEHKNSYPQAPGAYTDWKWTILNNSVLRIKTTYFADMGDLIEYYYFNIDGEKQCLSFNIARFRIGSDVQVDEPEIGEVDYGDSSDYTLKIQHWVENEKFIGKIIPNFSDYPDADQKVFWVELTQENYEPQTDWEEHLGL